MCYISHCTSDCSTNDKDTTDYDSSFLMNSDKINSLRCPLLSSVSNRRNMFGNPFIINVFG